MAGQPAEFCCDQTPSVFSSRSVRQIQKDVVEKSGKRLNRSSWYVCIETLRLVATCNGLDCSGLDDAKAPPVQWAGKLNTGDAPVHLFMLGRLGLELAWSYISCFEVIVLCDEQLEQVGWPRSFAYVQHCLANVTTWITHRILLAGCRSQPVWPERRNAEHRRFVGLHRWESRRCPTGTEGTKNWPVDPRGWFFWWWERTM